MVNWESLISSLSTLGILVGLFILIYSKIKNQTLKESWDEVVELIKPTEIE